MPNVVWLYFSRGPREKGTRFAEDSFGCLSRERKRVWVFEKFRVCGGGFSHVFAYCLEEPTEDR